MPLDHQMTPMLRTLRLSGVLETLDVRNQQAVEQQLSYAEFYVTDVYWPDFSLGEFHKALLSYGKRHRRFGGVDESNA